MLFGTVIGGTADPYQTGAPDFDTIAPPPSPNSAYAFLSTPLESALYHDRRDVLGPNAGDSIVWTVKVFKSTGAGTPETTMTLTWDSIPGLANFPLDATIMLTGFGPAVDMRAQDSATVPRGDYTAHITVTRLPQPDTVWVDDDYSGVNGTYEGMQDDTVLIYGYNAFTEIQYGIDAVANSTVYVLDGYYSAFNITGRTDLTVKSLSTGIGSIVNTFDTPWSSLRPEMCLVTGSTDITIDGLTFEWTGDAPATGDSAMHFTNSNSCEVVNVHIDGIKFDGPTAYVGYGIQVGSITSSSIDLDYCFISNCNVGVYVHSGSEATIENSWITGGGEDSHITAPEYWSLRGSRCFPHSGKRSPSVRVCRTRNV